MAYTYSAGITINDSDGRSLNLTETPTITVWDFDAESEIITPSPSIVNITTGLYKVKITINDLTTVAFKVVPHVDDQAAVADIKVMQVKAEHVADDILVDTGTTLPSTLALEATLTAIKGAGWSDETLVALKTAIDAGATAQEVWEYATRTLTMTATEVIAAVSGSTITQVRGSTWDFDISGVTLDANKQQFFIKKSSNDADADAIIGIDSETGLIVLNGSDEVTASNATLTYDAGTEVLNVMVKAIDTAQTPSGEWKYGAQGVSAAGVVAENYIGDYNITADIVRASS